MTEQIANENQCPMCCGPATIEIIESELAYGCEPNTVILQVHDLGCDPDEVLAERKRLKNERLQNSDQR